MHYLCDFSGTYGTQTIVNMPHYLNHYLEDIYLNWVLFLDDIFRHSLGRSLAYVPNNLEKQIFFCTGVYLLKFTVTFVRELFMSPNSFLFRVAFIFLGWWNIRRLYLVGMYQNKILHSPRLEQF